MAKKSTSSNKKRLVKVEAVGQAHVQQHHHFFDQFYWSGDFMVFRRKDGFQRI